MRNQNRYRNHIKSDATSKNSLGDVKNGMMLIRMQVRDNWMGGLLYQYLLCQRNHR